MRRGAEQHNKANTRTGEETPNTTTRQSTSETCRVRDVTEYNPKHGPEDREELNGKGRTPRGQEQGKEEKTHKKTEKINDMRSTREYKRRRDETNLDRR